MEKSSFPWLKFYDPDVIPEGFCNTNIVVDMLDRSAAEHPENIAISFSGMEMPYAVLKQKTELMAASLKKHGLAPGGRVAIMLPNLPQLIMSVFAVLKAGGVFVMVNPAYTGRELVSLLSDAGADLLITMDTFWPRIDAIREDIPVKKFFLTGMPDVYTFPKNYIEKFKALRETRKLKIRYDKEYVFAWSDLFSEKIGISTPATSTDDIAALQYTGGTTGESKGVMLTHHNICVNVDQVINFMTPDLVKRKHMFPGVLPYFHVYGLTFSLFTPIALGATIVPFPRFAPHELLHCMAQQRATVFGGSPSMFIALMRQKEIKKCDLSSLVFNICGSAPIPVEYLKEFEELTGVDICEGYGLTEASPITHINPIKGLHKPGSIGVPLPGTDAKVVDMELGTVEVPNGKAGELIVKGPQVMKGYWNRPDDTASTVRNGWLYTGDIAIMDDDGYFFIVDRKKDMAIVGGYNVYPREIDEVLHGHPKIKEAVSVGIPHPSKGEVMKAYVVLEDGVSMDKNEVIAYCREHLAQYKVPRQIEFRDGLPRTMVGKVLRRVLQAEEIEKQQKRKKAV